VPAGQLVNQGRQWALETVGRIRNADRKYDANRRPEITVGLAHDAAIYNVHNAARHKDEYQRMSQFCQINPIHVFYAVSKSNNDYTNFEIFSYTISLLFAKINSIYLKTMGFTFTTSFLARNISKSELRISR